MSTDRELLELAAKAAGEVIDRWALDENGVEYAWLESGDPWQPLHRNTVTDCMGDALRLAVKLRLEVNCTIPDKPTISVYGNNSGRMVARHEQRANAPYAATCRAIVRVAAEFGRKS